MLPEPISDDDVVDDADDNSDGEQVTPPPSECAPITCPSRSIEPCIIESLSRLGMAALGALRFTCIQGKVPGGVGWLVLVFTGLLLLLLPPLTGVGLFDCCDVGVFDCSILTKVVC